MSALDKARHRAHKIRNIVHSLVLIAALALLMSLCAFIIWGWSGIIWGLGGAVLSFAIGPTVTPRMTMRMFRARPLDDREAGALNDIVRVLSERAALPAVPKLNLIPSPTLNAFAVGKPEDAAIGVSSGLLEKLSLREVAGVLAHEISHIANNDLWTMGLADTFSRLTQTMSWLGVLLLLFNLPTLFAGGGGIPWAAVALLYFAPTIGSLLQLALSRAREYDADLEGAELTGDPAGLASALDKLERYQGRMWEDMTPAGRKIPIPSLLRSHPPTEERVRRLLELKKTVSPQLPFEPAGQIQLVGRTSINPRPRFYWPGVWF